MALDDARSDEALPHDAAMVAFDAVDAALAQALEYAAAAGRFDVVMTLAQELGARRQGRASTRASSRCTLR
jgi:hypothetical protein